MAITVTIDNDLSFNSLGYDGFRVHASLAWDDSYPTGGEAVSAGDFGLNELLGAYVNPTNGFVFSWDQENTKILVYQPGSVSSLALVEASNTRDLSSLTGVQMWAMGR